MWVFHDFGRVPDSSRNTRLRSHAQLWSEDATPIICASPVVCPTPVGRRDSERMPDYGRKPRLRSYA
jgi:hypothetical protein